MEKKCRRCSHMALEPYTMCESCLVYNRGYNRRYRQRLRGEMIDPIDKDDFSTRWPARPKRVYTPEWDANLIRMLDERRPLAELLALLPSPDLKQLRAQARRLGRDDLRGDKYVSPYFLEFMKMWK